jgi:F-type H+-transporting ATPase subunit epsilon
MANSYPLDVVTPERNLLSEDVTETNAPGTEGYLGILAHHAPIMTELVPGEVRITHADDRTVSRIVISGGFLEMSPDGRATILADSAQRADEIDLTRAERELEKARQMLEEADAGSAKEADARAAITHAETQLRVGRDNR